MIPAGHWRRLYDEGLGPPAPARAVHARRPRGPLAAAQRAAARQGHRRRSCPGRDDRDGDAASDCRCRGDLRPPRRSWPAELAPPPFHPFPPPRSQPPKSAQRVKHEARTENHRASCERSAVAGRPDRPRAGPRCRPRGGGGPRAAAGQPTDAPPGAGGAGHCGRVEGVDRSGAGAGGFGGALMADGGKGAIGSPARVRVTKVVRTSWRIEWEYDGHRFDGASNFHEAGAGHG